ncbi:CLC_0170 family protein [Wukongibacter baidiensis]|uniref:CLC_0170 family protein n=1 Tax=Wukongibacter baidiensis TaxID=1723361 RepID=UPI003D7F199B
MTMEILEKLKSLATMYMFFLILGTSLFTIFIDHKALKKKKLNREAKICKFIGYLYLIGGTAFFIAMKYVV